MYKFYWCVGVFLFNNQNEIRINVKQNMKYICYQTNTLEIFRAC